MKASQSRQKSYHDKRRKDIEFREDDHVFLRVNHVTSVRRALKSKKPTPKFIGLYQISHRIEIVAYRVVLPPYVSNLYNVIHLSQLRKYILDLSHVIQMDDVQVRDNLMVEALSVRIKDLELKKLRGKEIALVKFIWGVAVGGNMTWELKSQMREVYPKLFLSGKFTKKEIF
ncbi:uncharacterized protein LOC127137340 [Lathyrus oleraceus]|uniref:uncharacterized protein LOC127137340 n=1 Tax=Pisum sativum TaxID=3888 RepID=UPI0021D35820|nr:uncharacterized protein LOC127137340 [Pisum sativum]